MTEDVAHVDVEDADYTSVGKASATPTAVPEATKWPCETVYEPVGLAPGCAEVDAGSAAVVAVVAAAFAVPT